ncbi:MAG: hypothetical protein K2I35_02290, partial [Duncaniella sp.]|nr:hypothetical protein [Duncaniella sp.]
IDVAFMYVAGLGVDNASCEYEDLLGKQMYQMLGTETASQLGFQPTGKFTADYKLHALVPSIGISYSF